MNSLNANTTPSLAKEDTTVINVDHVSMVFNIANQKLNDLKEYFVALMKRELMFKEFRALNDITFEVKKGDVFGILGVNGSGKSTLLKIIAGILKPTTGHVSVRGRIAPLIELGAGFDMDLTARENIYLNGALLGYSKAFISEKFDEIVEFAEIGKFLDMPIKNFSSGMISRVAFAIATVVVPDILIVDEVLSVGDFMFRKKCEARIQELIDDHGTTILLVSHSDSQIERLCNKAVWIDKSNMRMLGSAKEVVRMYRMMGGRTGSASSEKQINQMLDRVASLPDEYLLEHSGRDPYAVNRSVVANQTEHLDTHRAILVPSGQFRAQILAVALGKHINAPVILTSKKDLVPANASFLQELHPEEIVIIDRLDEENGISLESSVKMLTGVTPVMLANHDNLELSLAVMRYGNEIAPWKTPVIIEPESMVSFSLAYPLLAEASNPLVFTFHEDLVTDVAKRLEREFPSSSPIVFGADEDNIAMRPAKEFSSSFNEIQTVNIEVANRYRDQSDRARAIVITSPHLDSIFNALLLASSQHSHVIVYDNRNFDEIVRTLEIIDSLRPIGQIAFINQDLSLNELDQKLIASVAQNGLLRQQ